MPDAFFCRLENKTQYTTIVLHDNVLIVIRGNGTGKTSRTIQIMDYTTVEVARLSAVRETEQAEENGFELWRIYSCPDSPTLQERVHVARREYAYNTVRVGDAVDRVVSHAIANSTILWPTDWASW